MTQKKIGRITFKQVPESVRNFLKIKEDTWVCNLSKSFLQENKINPEDLIFDIIKDSNKIKLVAHGTERTELENHTPVKMEASNIGK